MRIITSINAIVARTRRHRTRALFALIVVLVFTASATYALSVRADSSEIVLEVVEIDP